MAAWNGPILPGYTEHHKEKYMVGVGCVYIIMSLIDENCRSHKATGARGQVATTTSR